MENGVIAIVSVFVNIVLAYLLFFAYTGRQPSRGDPDGKIDNLVGEHAVVRPSFKRYVVKRYDDVSGVSGTGVVCEVAEFSDGHAALHWLGRWPLTTPHPDGIESIEAIHGHEGKTRVVPID